MSDVDEVRGKKESKKWDCVFFTDTELMLESVKPDVVVIASPDSLHTEHLLLALRHGPKLIICEKPVVAKKAEMAMLEQAFRGSKAAVIVNFSRRFDASVGELRDLLRKGKYGKIISANGVYTNGVLHNGSHLFDLARFLFGEVKSVRGYSGVPDHNKGDPSVSGFATFQDCPEFTLMTGDERQYAIFELEIITEKKRIRFENFGQEMVTQDVVRDPIFKGFKALSKRKVTMTKLVDAMPELYRHAAEVLNKKKSSRSSLADAMKTQAACFRLLESITSKK
jgi:predicted dehydrogenase